MIGRDMADKPIKFTYGKASFTVYSREDALALYAALKEQDAAAAMDLAIGRLGIGGKVGEIKAYLADEAFTPWTPQVFHSFIERLGAPQQAALAVLVTRQRVTDEELRKALNISGNQALAGVLSGISKRAAALDIPARLIFEFENFRNAGKRRSTYTVAGKFLKIATDMNWPPPTFKE
jgi:hypothetical protein